MPIGARTRPWLSLPTSGSRPARERGEPSSASVFDTDLIDAIARHRHTVDALRPLSKAALRQTYTEQQVDAIQAKIVRQPIPEDVVVRILAAAGDACCYCEDGSAPARTRSITSTFTQGCPPR
jgi:hypothetical protein